MATFMTPTPVMPSEANTASGFTFSRYRLLREMVQEYDNTRKIRDILAQYHLSWYQGDNITFDVNPLKELQNFTKVFGPFDKTDALMPALLQEFVYSKEDSMEQVLKCTNELVNTSVDVFAPISEVIDKLENLEEEIRMTFSINELKTLIINPYSSFKWIEPFVFPRERLTFSNIFFGLHASSNPYKAFMNSFPSNFSRLPYVVRDFDGLGCYDPKLSEEFCEMSSGGFGKVILQRITTFFGLYHFGISISVLKKRLHEHLGYELDVRSLGFQTLGTFCSHMEDICCLTNNPTLPPPLNTVIFPASLRGFIRSMEHILHNVWHKFVSMLGMLETPVLVESSWKLAEAFIGLNTGELSLTSWGFESVLAFVKYCIKLYRQQNVYILFPISEAASTKSKDSDKVLKQLYVICGSLSKHNESFQFYEESKESEPAVRNLQHGAGVRGQMSVVQNLGLSEWVAESIKPGETIICSYGLSLRPNSIGVVRENLLVVYIGFRNRMTRAYNSMVGPDSFNLEGTAVSICDEDLVPRALVAVHFDGFWRRGTIVRNLPGSYYKLYLVDGVAVIVFHRSRIFKLLKEFTKFPAQGILCKLDLGSLGVSDERERKFRTHVLPDLKSVNFLEVTFLRREHQDGSDLPIWVIQIHRTFHKVKGKTLSALTSDLNETVVMQSHRKTKFKFDPNSIKTNHGGFGGKFQKIPENCTTFQITSAK